MGKNCFKNIQDDMKVFAMIGCALRDAKKGNIKLRKMLDKLYKLEPILPNEKLDTLIECCLVADIDAMPLIELDKQNCKKEIHYVLTHAV